MKWFAAKTLYRIEAVGEPKRIDEHYDAEAVLIEERVVLIQAATLEEAVQKSLANADEYATNTHQNGYGQEVRISSIGGCDCVEITETLAPFAELYSSTEVISSSVTVNDIVTARFGRESEPGVREVRRKFLNVEFSQIAKRMKAAD